MTEYNPIVARKSHVAAVGGLVNAAKLQAHCDWLNGMAWVKYSKQPFYLREHTDSMGETRMVLDRKI